MRTNSYRKQQNLRENYQPFMQRTKFDVALQNKFAGCPGVYTENFTTGGNCLKGMQQISLALQDNDNPMSYNNNLY